MKLHFRENLVGEVSTGPKTREHILSVNALSGIILHRLPHGLKEPSRQRRQ